MSAETLRFRFSARRRLCPITTAAGTAVGITNVHVRPGRTELEVCTPQGEVSWLGHQQGDATDRECIYWASSADRVPLGTVARLTLYLDNDPVARIEKAPGSHWGVRLQLVDYEAGTPLALLRYGFHIPQSARPDIGFLRPIADTLRKLTVVAAYARWRALTESMSWSSSP